MPVRASYQSYFEDRFHKEWDSKKFKFKNNKVNLTDILKRFNSDQKQVANFLFNNVIRPSVEEAPGHRSIACATALKDCPCIFVGPDIPDQIIKSAMGYAPDNTRKYLKLTFSFSENAYNIDIQLKYDPYYEYLGIWGVSVQHKKSHFYKFFSALTKNKTVDIWFDDENHFPYRQTCKVGYFTRKKIAKYIEKWPNEKVKEDQED